MKFFTRTLIVLVVILIVLGSGLIFDAKGMNYFISHIEKVVMSIGLFIAFAVIPYKYYRNISKYLLAGIVFVLFVTVVYSHAVKGAARWIDLGFIRFQPSEFAKIILLIHLAVMIEQKGNKIKDFKNGLSYMLIWIAVVCALIIAQPNVSTTMIIAFTSITLLFVGGARIFHLFSLTTGVLLTGGFLALFMSHSKARLVSFYDSIVHGKIASIQVFQSLVALGSGGFFGNGLARSKQIYSFLPEAHNDFIFSILGEEFGFVGSVAILFIYLMIFALGVVIAKRAKDDFGQLLAFGISFLIVFSAFIHVAVGLGLMPPTGITLPFMSFGGTSIIISSISLGILINIARLASKHEEIKRARA